MICFMRATAFLSFLLFALLFIQLIYSGCRKSARHSNRNRVDNVSCREVWHRVKPCNAKCSTARSHDNRNPFIRDFLVSLASETNHLCVFTVILNKLDSKQKHRPLLFASLSLFCLFSSQTIYPKINGRAMIYVCINKFPICIYSFLGVADCTEHHPIDAKRSVYTPV